MRKVMLACMAAALPIDLELMSLRLFLLYAWSWAWASSSSLTGFSCSFCAMVNPRSTSIKQGRTLFDNKSCIWAGDSNRPCWAIFSRSEPGLTMATNQKNSPPLRSAENSQPKRSEPSPWPEWWGELYSWPPVLLTSAIEESMNNSVVGVIVISKGY